MQKQTNMRSSNKDKSLVRNKNYVENVNIVIKY